MLGGIIPEFKTERVAAMTSWPATSSVSGLALPPQQCTL